MTSTIHFKMTKYKKAKAYIKAKRFVLYALRWQLSTPIYALVLYLVSDQLGYTAKTMIANFIGACIFYFIDKYIFLKHRHESE